MENPDRDKKYSFHGRLKGPRLRPNQASLVRDLLPRLKLPVDVSLKSHIKNTFKPLIVEDLRLEIGFGGGEHLAHQAKQNPHIGYIGAEPFVNGMAKMLATIEREKIENIRLFDRDVRPLLEELPDQTFSHIYLLFPDPWPKSRHHKRRFVNQQTLVHLHRILTRKGTFCFASDIDHYIYWTLREVRKSQLFDWQAGCADDWRQAPEGWPGTRYEAKAKREGRQSKFLTFEKL